MRKIAFFLLLLCTSLHGQVVQYGKIVNFNKQTREGEPLPGVFLTIPSEHDFQPTQSDALGWFRLRFAEHKVGDVVSGIEAKKHGYEVVNLHVTRSWTLTTADTLCIIMAPKGKVKEARKFYYETSGLMPGEMLFPLEGERIYEVESPLFAFHISRFSKGIEPSDVDLDIPAGNVVDDKTFAVVIANEDYQREQDVPYAIHDGEVFAEYCTTLLGIPEHNIHVVTDATLNNIRFGVDWLRANLEAHRGTARGIFYYSGHGIPDETSRNAYLLPIDGYGANMESAYSLDALYADLGSTGAEMLYFFDACFSGATRDGDMMAETRGVAVNAKAATLQGNAVALSAAQGNETAFAYKEKSHGIFTYFLLKKLKETQGRLTLGELADYINESVVRKTAVEGLKLQRPTATGTGDDWRNTRIK